GDATLARALRLMDEGLEDGGLPALAARLDLSERQLRRLFVERLGAAPLAVLTTRRLLFAKQLLSETRLPITEVALAAGFGSLRRFNTAFRDAYGLAPSQVRKGQAAPSPVLVLRLAYRPPYDFAAQLDFLRGHALPGVEVLDDSSYARVIGTPEQPGWLRVSAWDADTPALRLELHGAAPGELQAAVARIRRMFDLDADPEAIGQGLAVDPTLAE
ncbi:AlkA N-terminal domain-containing protein, partial [Pseudomonas oryzihabitans]